MQFTNTKIVCTLGPASSKKETIAEMIQGGMDIARLNFSHGSHSEKAEKIAWIRDLAAQYNKPVAIIGDLQGPKLRLGSFHGTKLITKGDEITLSIGEGEVDLPLQMDLAPFLKKGQRVFLNDGLIELVVTAVSDAVITTQAQNTGSVTEHKGINIPDSQLSGDVFTQKDTEDALFALEHDVDFLALSFIQRQEDVAPARSLIQKLNKKTKIIVKIEKQDAIKNLASIIQVSDGVIIARGDLGIETKAAELPIVQQKIIILARQQQKPVIVATQMLESMIDNPRPTRAEVSDVASAVLSQSDAVMLSAESASGRHPIEAVVTMRDIISSVEQNPDFNHYIKINWETISQEELSFNAIASTAAALAHRIHAPIIVVATATGRSAKLLSSFRPDAHIIAVTHDKKTYRELCLLWGVTPIIIEPTKQSDTFWNAIHDAIMKYGFAPRGSKIVMVGGSVVGVSGATDTIKIIAC